MPSPLARAPNDGRAGSRRYYTPREVAQHDSAVDCWVSFFGKVYDLTALLAVNKGPLAQPIIDHAGQDISHWFDAVTKDIKTHVNPATELRAPYTPMGRFIHVPPAEPAADWVVDFEKPWWQVRAAGLGRSVTLPASERVGRARRRRRVPRPHV